MTLPILLTGPMIRRAEPRQVTLFIVSSQQAPFKVNAQALGEFEQTQQILALGEHCFCHFYFLNSTSTKGFVVDTLISYQLEYNNAPVDLSAFYLDGQSSCSFVIAKQLSSILHGSCRNPHHESKDALITASHFLVSKRKNSEPEPSLLVMSGDQIYADDVAGPMLLAIEQLIHQLKLFKEPNLIDELQADAKHTLYTRDTILPITKWHERSKLEFGYWLRQDLEHFTSLKSHNHLVHLEEFFALYLLTTSAACWQLVGLDDLTFESNNQKHSNTFLQEKQNLIDFVDGLPEVERLFANISHITMFDDHDVTDDWNLTAGWEQAVYSNPISKRIIANGLISYLVFQGVGNDGGEYTKALLNALDEQITTQYRHLKQFDNQILAFDRWHYTLDTQPKIIALDTRTHRWRNETDFNEPSGLLDWEQLVELDDNMTGLEEVILISPAPVFGVKSIEAIQAIFNFCGQPLLVDVENWMAHEGAARKLMQIFKRADTPIETLILSGDVHYSFCFSVQSRFSNRDNRIWQLTASGIKNEFPKSLLSKLNTLDSILYHPSSPLNFFTKRWQMKVHKHRHKQSTKHLVSDSAISLVCLDNERLTHYQLLHGDGNITEFDLKEKS
ncbi:hypothetical protein PSPO_a1791 [Pseudoalteromonas spongiae UST010723-006]|nr:hypothetical protein PSPO_a1791 [Pseudoalteromonas spongiae UST010723-006]